MADLLCADADMSLDDGEEEEQGDVLAALIRPPLPAGLPRGAAAVLPRSGGAGGSVLPGGGGDPPASGSLLGGALPAGSGALPAGGVAGLLGGATGLIGGVLSGGSGDSGISAAYSMQMQMQQLQMQQLQQLHQQQLQFQQEEQARRAQEEQARKAQEAEASKKKRKRQGVDDLDEEEEVVAVRLTGVDGAEDDGVTKICWEARSLPPYTGDLTEFWKRQPMVVRPLRESYDASHLRMDPVNSTTTLRDHDRGAKRTIKQYAKANIRVSKTRAIITSSGQDTCDVGLANNFAECTGVYSLISALWQYTTNLFMIRRDDYSGMVLLRVLHDIKFFQPLLLTKTLTKAQRDAGQVQMCRHFIDEALEQNSLRGRQGRPPLEYEALLKLARSSTGVLYSGSGIGLGWDVGTDAVGLDPYSCAGSSSSPPAAAAGTTAAAGEGGGSRRRQQQAGLLAAARSAAPAPAAALAASARAGVGTCRDWNKGRCTRPTCK